MPTTLYEEEKKTGQIAKNNNNDDMRHVIKIYDRSNKHFYKQTINPHLENSQSKSMIDDGEEDVKHVMRASCFDQSRTKHSDDDGV